MVKRKLTVAAVSLGAVLTMSSVSAQTFKEYKMSPECSEAVGYLGNMHYRFSSLADAVKKIERGEPLSNYDMASVHIGYQRWPSDYLGPTVKGNLKPHRPKKGEVCYTENKMYQEMNKRLAAFYEQYMQRQ